MLDQSTNDGGHSVEAIRAPAEVDQPDDKPQDGAGSTPSMGLESLRDKLLLAAIVAVLSFLGATSGTLLSSRYEIAKWRRETDYTARQTILNRRIELLERTVRILNKSGAARSLQARIQAGLDLQEADIEYAKARRKDPDEATFGASMDRVMSAKLQLTELDAEYASTLSLDALYFGPKTRRIITTMRDAKVNGRWWELDQKLIDDLGAAMFDELSLYSY